MALRLEEIGMIDGRPGIVLRGTEEDVRAVAGLFLRDVRLCDAQAAQGPPAPGDDSAEDSAGDDDVSKR